MHIERQAMLFWNKAQSRGFSGSVKMCAIVLDVDYGNGTTLYRPTVIAFVNHSCSCLDNVYKYSNVLLGSASVPVCDWSLRLSSFFLSRSLNQHSLNPPSLNRNDEICIDYPFCSGSPRKRGACPHRPFREGCLCPERYHQGCGELQQRGHCRPAVHAELRRVLA